MRTTCRWTLEHLGDLTDDALAPVDADALRAHLTLCPACTSFVAGYAGTARVVREATAAEPPDDVIDRVLQRVAVR